MKTMTVAALMERLSHYAPDEACCGTFWLADDFRECDPSLTDDEIQAAMEVAHHGHDCSVGYNWEYLAHCIEVSKG